MPDLVRAGALEDLDPYVDKYGFREELQEIAPVYRDNQMTVDGKIYGFPDDGDVFVMYYRTDVLGDPKIQEAYKAKYGSDLPVPPKTWKEFDQVGVADHRGHRRQALRRRLLPRLPPYGQFMFQERFRNEGGKFFDAATMKATVNGPAGVKVFQDWLAENKWMPPGVETWDFVENLPAFLVGRHRHDHLLAALWPLGRGLRHRRGGAVLGAEEPGRRQGRLRHAAGWPSRSSRPASRSASPRTPRRRSPAYLFIQWLNSEDISIERVQLPYALRDPFRDNHFTSRGIQEPLAARRRSTWRRSRPVPSTACSTCRSSRPTSTRRRCARASPSSGPARIRRRSSTGRGAVGRADRAHRRRQAARRLRGVGQQAQRLPDRVVSRGTAPALAGGRLSQFADRQFKYLAITPAVVIILLIGLFPIVYSAVVSFQNINMLEEDTSFSGLLNYQRLLADTPLLAGARPHLPLPRHRPAGRADPRPAPGLPVPRPHARAADLRGPARAAGGDLADRRRRHVVDSCSTTASGRSTRSSAGSPASDVTTALDRSIRASSTRRS